MPDKCEPLRVNVCFISRSRENSECESRNLMFADSKVRWSSAGVQSKSGGGACRCGRTAAQSHAYTHKPSNRNCRNLVARANSWTKLMERKHPHLIPISKEFIPEFVNPFSRGGLTWANRKPVYTTLCFFSSRPSQSGYHQNLSCSDRR